MIKSYHALNSTKIACACFPEEHHARSLLVSVWARYRFLAINILKIEQRLDLKLKVSTNFRFRTLYQGTVSRIVKPIHHYYAEYVLF